MGATLITSMRQVHNSQTAFMSLISTYAFHLSPVKFLAWDMRRVVKRIEQDEKISFALFAFNPIRTGGGGGGVSHQARGFLPITLDVIKVHSQNVVYFNAK